MSFRSAHQGLLLHLESERCNNHTICFCYHDGNVVSPMTGQGPIQFKKSVMGLQEAAEVISVQRHHHGDVVHTAQWKKGFNQDVLVRHFFQNLKRTKKNEILPLKKTIHNSLPNKLTLLRWRTWIHAYRALMRHEMFLAGKLLPISPVEESVSDWSESHMESAFSAFSFGNTSVVLLLLMTWSNRHCSIAAQ